MEFQKITKIDDIRIDNFNNEIIISSHRWLHRKVQIFIFSLVLDLISFFVILFVLLFYNVQLVDINFLETSGIIIFFYLIILVFNRVIWSKAYKKNPYLFFANNSALIMSFLGFLSLFIESQNKNYFTFTNTIFFIFITLFLALIIFYSINQFIFIFTWKMKLIIKKQINDLVLNYSESFKLVPFTLKKNVIIYSDINDPLKVSISHNEKVKSSLLSGEKYRTKFFTRTEFEGELNENGKFYTLKAYKKDFSQNIWLMVGIKLEILDFLAQLSQFGNYSLITKNNLEIETDIEYPMFTTLQEIKNN